MSSRAPTAASQPPAIPGLELQEKIGEGGMSVVYRAVHRNLQRTVAVKFLLAPAEEASSSPSWLRESRLMASLAHPHVVAIYDAGEIEDHNYLVVEFMAGGSLRGRMSPGQPWLLAEALSLLERIAGAIGYIHGQGILHLDLKPENILYTTDGQIKIADFGLSVPHADANALLGGRQFQGTIDYCAPEYRAGLTLDKRFDVFSLATVAYELLTGRLPGRVYVPASRRNTQLPKELDDILRTGLARDANDRYPSVVEFQNALAAIDRPKKSLVSARTIAACVAVPILAILSWVIYKRQSTAPIGLPVPAVQVALEQPDRLVLFYEKPTDLSLLSGDNDGKLASGSDVVVERALFEKVQDKIPAGLSLPTWPVPFPDLVIHSPHALGFVHPLQDRMLGQHAIDHWSNLLQLVVPPEKNLIKAGSFEEQDCLTKGNEGPRWRLGIPNDWDANRHITLDGQTLLFTNLNPQLGKARLRCYQALPQVAAPGAILVLRYRARSEMGKGRLTVSAVLPAEIPKDDTSTVAALVRRFAISLPPEPNDPVPNRWMHFNAAVVTPTTQWQTYLVIFESPPFPTRVLHRNLVIDVTADPPSAIDRIWVDDVELFTWDPGGKP